MPPERSLGSGRRVAAWPGRRRSNAYPAEVVASLERAGFRVSDLSPKHFVSAADALVVHWPERVVRSQSNLKTLVHVLSAMTVVLAARLRRVPIVLFLHNFRSHDQFHPRIERRFHEWFDRSVASVVHLSEFSRQAVEDHRPALSDKPCIVIRHGAYRCNFQHEPPSTLPSDVRLTTVGALRPYKGYEALLDEFSKLSGSDCRLDIRGSSPTEPLMTILRSKAERDARVTLDIGYLSDEDLGRTIRNAHAAVLPYQNILNSGSAIHVLTEGGRVIGPRAGALPELQDDVGTDWVHLYTPPLTADHLRRAIEWASGVRPHRPPDLSLYSWDLVGRQLAEFVADCCDRKHQ